MLFTVYSIVFCVSLLSAAAPFSVTGAIGVSDTSGSFRRRAGLWRRLPAHTGARMFWRYALLSHFRQHHMDLQTDIE